MIGQLELTQWVKGEQGGGGCTSGVLGTSAVVKDGYRRDGVVGQGRQVGCYRDD